jgi:hypothetical protein
VYVIGYCESCHRVRRVRVTQMHTLGKGTTPVGICRDCEGK